MNTQIPTISLGIRSSGVYTTSPISSVLVPTNGYIVYIDKYWVLSNGNIIIYEDVHPIFYTDENVANYMVNHGASWDYLNNLSVVKLPIAYVNPKHVYDCD